MFSEKESAYLKSQRLARIATASEDIQPDVAPVGFDFDGTHFYVGGINLPTTLKYKNIQKNPQVSLVIDDLESISPWKPRALRFMGTLTSPHVLLLRNGRSSCSCKNAYTSGEIQQFISQTSFARHDIREDAIGMTIWLEK